MKNKNEKSNNPKIVTLILEKLFRIRSHPNVSRKNRIVRAYIFGFDELVPAVNKATRMPELESENPEHKN